MLFIRLPISQGEKMNVAIMGPGRLANTVAEKLKQMSQVSCYAVASRSIERANAFSERHGFKKAYGSYEALVEDSEVELVYITTPHSEHFENMRLCLTHDKPVLCEKSFTLNSQQAKEIIRISEKRNVFVAEAMWTRYMPSKKIIAEIAQSGVVGKIKSISADLSYPVLAKNRVSDIRLGGGALLDVGVYTINFATMILGNDIDKVVSNAVLSDNGVDLLNSISLSFRSGGVATLSSGVVARSSRQGILSGEKGYIVVDNINDPHAVRVYDTKDSLLYETQIPSLGYEYEFSECIQAIHDGAIEPPSLPHAQIIATMELMDTIRRQWGMVFPAEAISV